VKFRDTCTGEWAQRTIPRKDTDEGRRYFNANEALAPLLHHKPTTLFFGEIEFLGSSDYCGRAVWRIHAPEDLGAALPE
jgi:hypothetical protein